MRVTVNGERKEIAAGNLTGLLGEMEFEGRHMAIAVNYRVVPRPRWARDRAERRRPGRNPHAAARWLT